MFGDIGGFELMVIAIVALIVIGPKDLPEMFRQVGRFTAKIRATAREFSRAMEQAATESGMADAAKDLKSATSPSAMGLDKVKAAADKFEKWDPLKPTRIESKPAPTQTAPTQTAPIQTAPAVSAPAEPTAPPVKAQSASKPASKPSSKADTSATKPAAAKSARPKAAPASKSPRQKVDPT
jgi:sec-independent protein translocase protein TatB